MEPYLTFLSETYWGHLLLITSLHLLTWGYCVFAKLGFVSDDIEGVAKFSDRFIQEKDPQGNIIKEYKIDDYELEVGRYIDMGKSGPQKVSEANGKVKVKIKNTGWNPYIEFPGCLLRWFRINWGKKFGKIGENTKGHKIYGWVQSSRKHHLLNLIVQWFNLLLGYNLITHLFGAKLALLSMLLFAVHPCGVQTIAWISGINYLFSLCGALLTFNLALYIQNPYLYIPVLGVTSAISCLTLLPGCLNWSILILMGKSNAAIIAGVIGLIVLLRQGKEVVSYRSKAFKEQKMEKSTTVYWRKVIIMVKTFWYYVRLIPFPKRLGLFHTWGYHFDETLEHIDKEFWAGAISLLGYGIGFIFAPPPVQFGLLWAFVYLLVFCNFITAQQFVSERYAFYSTFGFSVVVAYFLQNNPIIIAFLIGIAVMRVWFHLPTFKNEVRFYESNWFNFPDSEVAMGNLGVAYLNHGLPNKSLDTWLEASRQNKLYDVPWYNLYSLCKQNGDIVGARRFLRMCLDAKTVHFPDQWHKELQELDSVLTCSVSIGELTNRVNKAIKEAKYECAGTL